METGETGGILLALTQIGDLDVPGVGAYCIRPTGTRPFFFSCLYRKLFRNIPLKKKKLLGRKHWIGNEVENERSA